MTAGAVAEAAGQAASPGGALRETGDGRFRLEGAVTMATVTNLRVAGLRAFAQTSGAIDIDLSGVARADSGGLALLIDWLAWARAAQRAMKFSSIPAALLALARLSDVEDLVSGAGH